MTRAEVFAGERALLCKGLERLDNEERAKLAAIDAAIGDGPLTASVRAYLSGAPADENILRIQRRVRGK